MLNLKIDLNGYDKNKAALFLFALNSVYNIQPVHELFNQVIKAGPISINIVPREQAPFGAKIEIDRTIYLANDQPIYEAISAVLFELCNAANPGFNNTPCSKFKNADDFANAIEAVEYNTIRRHALLMNIVCRQPNFRQIIKAEFPHVDDALLDKSCELLVNAHLKRLSRSFEDVLQSLKTKKPGQLLSHYDNYKSEYHKWEKEHRPLPMPAKGSGRKLPEIPVTPKASGRKLPALPNKKAS
ncbi:MAG: hypothetical protein AB7I18_11525 [Candidatus Berkiella sp.]